MFIYNWEIIENKNIKLENNNNSDLNQKEAKVLKNEIKSLMDELYKIKETWTPPDKKKEYINNIDSLEKNNKILKEDINKKKEYIIHFFLRIKIFLFWNKIISIIS